MSRGIGRFRQRPKLRPEFFAREGRAAQGRPLRVSQSFVESRQLRVGNST
jgi:hypothetical protein